MIEINEKNLPKTPLAEGGEGCIYEYNNLILKVYKKDKVDLNEKLEKVTKLINKNLPKNVIKPIELVYNQKKQFIGYAMQKIEGEDFSTLAKKKHIKVHNITIKNIIQMLKEIKDVLQTLHQNNIVIGDLNDGNILYDKNFNVYFIDTDSWSVDNIKCTVAMDTFKDPQLVSNNFSKETDAYSFAVLAFKSLTKIHPFGGTTDPDMPLLERMKRGLSVLDSKGIALTIPKTIGKWTFINPELLKEFQVIFDNTKRNLIDKSLDLFIKHIKHCDKHNDYYYGKFTVCPICNDNAKITKDIPVKSGTVNGIPCILLMSGKDIKAVLSLNSYINFDNQIVHKDTNHKIPLTNGYRYYFSENGNIIYATNDKEIHIKKNDEKYKFEKKYKTNVIVNDKEIYFLNLNNKLVKLTIDNIGNSVQNITDIAINSLFNIIDNKNYFVCNIYSNMKIINVNGYEYTLKNDDKIINYGIHFDKVTNKWLMVTENQKGIFDTYVFDKNDLVYHTDKIKYTSDLDNIAFDNNTMFKAGDKFIRGFNYIKNAYKDFACDVVNEDSKLIKEGSKFFIINEQEIYRLG